MPVIELPPPAIDFTVFGIPAPKGSKRGFPVRRKATGKMGVSIVEGKTDRQKDWARRIEEIVQTMAEQGAPMLDCPLEAQVTFYLPRPASAPKRRRTWPDRKPDLDKLCRALLDPMTGVLVADDARFVRLDLHKVFAVDSGDERPRAHVMAWRVEDLQPSEREEVRTDAIRRPGAQT